MEVDTEATMDTPYANISKYQNANGEQGIIVRYFDRGDYELSEGH